jgi:hypothetical protein
MSSKLASPYRTGEWRCHGKYCLVDKIWVTFETGVAPAEQQPVQCPECGRTMEYLGEVALSRAPRNGAT